MTSGAILQSTQSSGATFQDTSVGAATNRQSSVSVDINDTIRPVPFGSKISNNIMHSFYVNSQL